MFELIGCFSDLQSNQNLKRLDLYNNSKLFQRNGIPFFPAFKNLCGKKRADDFAKVQ